ncbi:alpha carbonic anhydrase 7-like [Neltuma alba]|uniref:alpha carbonic anhydrase 7-like n=1 Tax=Neltuma alba TaxID=207710 RepID=UPI0010A49C8F|nr:alpha carbonic anhydrase 7-like [Prosopis alba]
MKPQSNLTVLILVLLVIISVHSTLSRAQEVEDEREFDYVKGSEKGPQHWGDLKEEWAACKHGDLQSPVDLSTRRVRVIPKFGFIKTTYKTQNATLKNRGHDIQVKWEGDAGSIRINGSDYFLHQAHWHSPSEHTINGRRYDLELHMVHSSSSNPEKVVVVGLLYKIGCADPFLSKLEKYLKEMVDEIEEEGIGKIHPLEIRTRGRNYYTYMGSLTVPPCTEGVLWIIDHKVRTVSREQVKLLKEAVHDHAESNARPLQPHNDRQITLHVPIKKPRY